VIEPDRAGSRIFDRALVPGKAERARSSPLSANTAVFRTTIGYARKTAAVNQRKALPVGNGQRSP
jgi:hypothetical protein